MITGEHGQCMQGSHWVLAWVSSGCYRNRRTPGVLLGNGPRSVELGSVVEFAEICPGRVGWSDIGAGGSGIQDGVMGPALRMVMFWRRRNPGLGSVFARSSKPCYRWQRPLASACRVLRRRDGVSVTCYLLHPRRAQVRCEWVCQEWGLADVPSKLFGDAAFLESDLEESVFGRCLPLAC